jgi:hypothetical protein
MFFSLSTYLIVTANCSLLAVSRTSSADNENHPPAACNIPSVRNMMCTSDQVVKFFEYSPKKQTVFEKLIDETVN